MSGSASIPMGVGMASALSDLVDGLCDPAAYPEQPASVDFIQTQMSVLFMTDAHVYKVKKPVDLGYLDYRSLESRKHFCQRELELNRRLSPTVYLEVLPVTQEDGAYRLGGQGDIVDYAVKMRRLPAERMLSSLLSRGEATSEMLELVAKKLAEFHASAEPISDGVGLELVKQNTEENFTQTAGYIGRTIDQSRFDAIRDYTRRFIREHEELFERRVSEGRIRDGHGDLHAQHVCFTDEIVIYDCIEFNDRFRHCDVACDLAFLAMDLEHFGQAPLAKTLVDAYVLASGDKDLLTLLPFYKCYLAYVRAKVACFTLEAPLIPDDERAHSIEKARAYFDLAYSYTKSNPQLILMMGLVGTGKSTFAEALAKRLAAAVLSSDLTRKELAQLPSTQREHSSFESGIYAPEFTRKTYDELYRLAQGFLNAAYSVILDASFLDPQERKRARELAERSGADYRVVECVADESVIKQRLTKRLETESVSDGRWEIYLKQKEKAPSSDSAAIIINSAQDMALNLRQVLEQL